MWSWFKIHDTARGLNLSLNYQNPYWRYLETVRCE
jgi:hypothetical protein